MVPRDFSAPLVHGGDLDAARRLFPDAPEPFIDLSTGINPYPYPVPEIPSDRFFRLPDQTNIGQLAAIAAQSYGAPSEDYVVPAPGTQILLPQVAMLVAPGRAAILGPTYAEHLRAATLAGHVTVEDHATIGAFSGVHQYCRIGTHGYVGGYSVITKDVLPYSKTVSERNTQAFGVNTIGLERMGFRPEQVQNIKTAFRLLLQSKLNTTQALEAIQAQIQSPEVQVLVDFIKTSSRGVIK